MIRVACFGAGWVTTHRHIPAMRESGRFEVVAVVDRNGARARAAAESLGIPRAVEGRSVEDLPMLDEIDAVTCGTAPFSHFDVVASALDAGKAAITEKPFTMTLEEGEELGRRAADARRTLAVVHNFQFARSVREVDAWIARGRLGTPRAVWAAQLSNPARRLPVWIDELPLGLFYDESPHLFYLVRHFAPDSVAVRSVRVVPSRVHAGTTPAQVSLQLDGTLPVSITMNFEAPVSEWQLLVMGDAGLAAVDVFRDIAVFVPNDRDHRTPTVLRTSLVATWHHWLGYARSGPAHLRGRLRYGNVEVFTRFAQAVTDGTAPAGISVADGLAVLRLQHDVVGAARAETPGEFSGDGGITDAVAGPPVAPRRLGSRVALRRRSQQS